MSSRSLPRALRSRTAFALLVAACLWAVAACSGKQPVSEETRPEGAEVPVQPLRLSVRRVLGRRGLTSTALPDGAYLGEGAELSPGATYGTGPADLVELADPAGVRLRLDAATRIRLDDGGRLHLLEGRLLAETPQGPFDLLAGEDRFRLERGEAQVERSGDTGRYMVVQGRARLTGGGRTVDLSTGAVVETPLSSGPDTPPAVSVAPLVQASWADAFDQARRLSEEAPAGVGTLKARRPRTAEPFDALAVADQRVFVSVRGRVATTTVRQTFRNDLPEELEGLYVFPVPEGASISGLRLLVNGRWMDGEVVERTEARRIYKEIVDAVVPRDPALLEWQHGSVFRMRVFPIPPYGTRQVELSYTEVLPVAGDRISYRYPFAGNDSGTAGTTIEHFSFSARIDGRYLPEPKAAGVTPRMLDAAPAVEGRDVTLGFEADRFVPAYPVGFDLPAPPFRHGVAVQAEPGPEGRTYWLATVRPVFETAAPSPPPDVVFVFDRSHGTAPALWSAARALFSTLAGRLPEGARVAVLACDAACDVGPGALAPMDEHRMQALRAFLDDQVLAGASDLGGMVRRAAEVAQTEGGAGSETRRTLVVYLGDGVATAGELVPDELLRRQADVLAHLEFHAVALGSRADLLMLHTLAARTGGEVVAAGPTDDPEHVVRRVAAFLAVPPLRDVVVELPPGIEEIYPRGPIPLRPGAALTLFGRLAPGLRSAAGTLQVTGRDVGGRPVRFSSPMEVSAPSGPASAPGGVAHLWAKQAVDHLTATRGWGARGEIVALSTRHRVMSRYTAWLVLENEEMYRRFLGRYRGKRVKRGRHRRSRSSERARAARPPAQAEMRTDPYELSDPFGGPGEMGSAPATGSGALSPAPARRARRPRRPAPDADALLPESAPAVPLAEAGPSPGRGHLGGKAPSPLATGGPGAGPASTTAWPGVASGGGGRLRPIRIRFAEPAPYLSERAVPVPALVAARDAAPTRRSAHRTLVRAALAAADPQAVTYARAWVEADPDHPEAVAALADALALAADPLHLRVRGGVAEARPFSFDTHVRLAEAYAHAGDLVRAAAHLRAAASIAPTSVEAFRRLATVLMAAGRADRARAILNETLARPSLAHGNRAREEHVRAELSALRRTLSRLVNLSQAIGAPPDRWQVAFDAAQPRALALVLVDDDGRVTGTVWPEKLTLFSAGTEAGMEGRTRKWQTLHAVNPTDTPVAGILHVRAGDRDRTFPVHLGPRRSVPVVRFRAR